MSTLAVILAAGQGKRMHQAFPGTPKVLAPLGGKPMLVRLLESIRASDAVDEIVVVLGPAVEAKIRAILPSNARVVLQLEPKGTGDAVRAASDVIARHDLVLVLYGDHALVRPETISSLVRKHKAGGGVLTMASVALQDFLDWRAVFADWAKIVRDENGRFVEVVEAKDASETELKITEVNPGFYVFDRQWLLDHLPRLTKHNAQGEYYLTELIGMATSEGHNITTIPVADPREAMGVNNPEQLAMAERFLAVIARE